MKLKEEFLKVETYEEYDAQREKYRSLDFNDKEVKGHFLSLFPKLEKSGCEDGIIVEAYKEPPEKRMQK